MIMTGLTPEQRQLVEQAGDRPVRIEDPELRRVYFLLRDDVYERVRDVLEAKPAADIDIPEGIRQSQDAFFRDLPELLKDERLRGKWVAYHRDERVKIGRRQRDVLKEIVRRDIPEDEYDVFVIEPQSREPEEIDFPSSWYAV